MRKRRAKTLTNRKEMEKKMKRRNQMAAFCLSVAMVSGMVFGGNMSMKVSAAQETETETALQEQAAATKTITDAYGEEVEIPAEVKSIAATMWPIPSVIFTVTGSGDAIKTMAQGSMEAYNISMFKVLCPGLEDLPTNCLDSSSNITFEELAKVEPDVILCNEAVEQELGEQMRAIGAVPVKMKFGEFTDVQELIRIVGEIFDCEDRATELIDFQKEILSYLDEKKADHPADEEKPTVLYITRRQDNDQYQVVCPKHLGAKLVDIAGGKNVTADLVDEGTTTVVGMEQIMAWNPDVIFLSNFDDFTPENFYEGNFASEWQSINAVKNNRVYKTPIGLYRWDTQCVEAPLMAEWTANVLNPEIYTEFDFKEELENFYSKYMNYKLTDEDLAMILHTDENVYLNLDDEIYAKK